MVVMVTRTENRPWDGALGGWQEHLCSEVCAAGFRFCIRTTSRCINAKFRKRLEKILLMTTLRAQGSKATRHRESYSC